ncbi:hypothetical protein LTR97_001017 [Elasticomyces elasticus]|uniref:Amino acid permease/ SLC12A domain-containing protein n=1 Tax=Elasticomyces elasticus TaxID=574655 RepID=A0AAN8A4V0_9PEZI|nr:hypothetical protein LTR97_001017 [Elasticomyces elasticus]
MLSQDVPFGKLEATSNEVDLDTALQEVNNEDKPYDPAYDRRDMRRLGRIQEVKRRFRFFSIVGYMVILASTWEYASTSPQSENKMLRFLVFRYSLVTSVFSLSNGGTAGTIWLTLIACCGMSVEYASRFAPPGYQKPLSYAVGWLCALGWQSAMPLISYTAAQQVIALIATCQPDFVWKGWQGALLTIAFVVFAILFNMFAINKMPLIEGLVVTIHIFGFFAFVVIFWVLGPREPASRVFTEFQDQNGWGSYGLATLVAVVGPSSALIGADAAVHLAEELKDASYILPRAMVSSALINYATAFTMIISFVSAIDPASLEDVLATSTGQPWVAVIRHVTGSQAATIALAVVMCFQLTFTSINQATTSSRQLWAFARDKGVPFHGFLSKVSERDGVPHNAVFVTLGSTVVFSMIIIGSTIAFNVILSVCNVALIISYIICIATMVAKRLRGEKLPLSRFNLGRAGLFINIAALCWLSVLGVFLCFPAVPNPTPASMNWACLMFGVVMIFACVWYFVRGRHEYDGPVRYIRKDVE